jgi:hypothetical protein
MGEQYILIFCAAVTVTLSIALLVAMGRKGLGVAPRLYVAIIAVSILTLCQTAITGERPLGYFPEISLAMSSAIGVIAGLVATLWGQSDQMESRHRQAGAWRSLF